MGNGVCHGVGRVLMALQYEALHSHFLGLSSDIYRVGPPFHQWVGGDVDMNVYCAFQDSINVAHSTTFYPKCGPAIVPRPQVWASVSQLLGGVKARYMWPSGERCRTLSRSEFNLSPVATFRADW